MIFRHNEPVDCLRRRFETLAQRAERLVAEIAVETKEYYATQSRRTDQ